MFWLTGCGVSQRCVVVLCFGGGGGDDLLSCSEETRSSWLWCAGTRMGGGRRRGLETGEDACRWTVRWREGEFGTRAYDHAAVKGGRAGDWRGCVPMDRAVA